MHHFPRSHSARVYPAKAPIYFLSRAGAAKAASPFSSAILVGALTALCYAFGHITRYSDAIALGIPFDILPDRNDHATTLQGFTWVLTILIMGLLGFLLVVLISKTVDRLFPHGPQGTLRSSLNRAIESHPQLYLFMFVLIVLTSLWTLSIHPVGQLAIPSGASLPKVLELRLKPPLTTSTEHLTYFGRKDGWLVLRKDNGPDFVLIRAEAVELFRIRPSR